MSDRVDLIVPRFPPAHWNFAFAMDIEGSAYSHPPLGAASLAAYTPPGIEVRILDENLDTLDLDATAPVVGLSAMYVQRQRTFELAAELRARGRHVIIGGSISLAIPSECTAAADTVFFGEAESTWPRFLADLQAGRAKKSYKAAGRFDLEASRLPRYDLLDLSRYSTGSIQTSRGCPYSCDFCDVPYFDGNRSRTKSIETIMTEVEILYARGLDSIFFVDDHFLGAPKFAAELLDELRRWGEPRGYPVIFYCQATLNVAQNDEMLERLYRANFRRLFIGIESSNPEALRAVNKSHNTKMGIAEAVAKIQRHNIAVWCALLAGFDQDEATVFDEHLRFAQQAQVGMVIPGLLQVVPGTPLFDHIEREGRYRPLENGYAGGQAASLDTLLVSNIEPKRMTYDELIGGYRQLCRALYQPDAYAERVVGFLAAGQRPELSRFDLKALWRYRGLLSRTARYYLTGDTAVRRLFFKVLAHLIRTGMRRVDEAAFHLVIYKHLREFYFAAADATVPLAEDVRRVARAA